MTVPACPFCHEPLTRVLDLPYGYWEWGGSRYVQRFTTAEVTVPPFACASCLRGLPEFHPQDAEPRVVITA